jgi:hypothetical protein
MRKKSYSLDVCESPISDSKERALVDIRLLLVEGGISDTPEMESGAEASPAGAARLDEDEMARVAKRIEELEGIFIVIYDQQDTAMTGWL